MFYLIPVNNNVVCQRVSGDGIILFRSSELNLASPANHTSLNLLAENNDIVLHIDFRCDEDAIVFNARNSEGWLREERISFGDKLKGNNHTVTVYDHGDRYQIAFNGRTGHYFRKQIRGDVVSLQYLVDTGHQALFSVPVVAETYVDLSALVKGLD
ncbi:concanavalin A-like lectin/glucanase domain-containing protein [Mycena galopus ATCC 62051]|nr:concanavalin A-like lectin/glucanase domain-containing protein [Mycena galopus ATCC 62051]